MTKRDFFILIIKLFGLYSIINSIFSVLPGSITFALSDSGIPGIIWIILVLVVVVGLFVVLIFKSENIVNLLKLDNGFDDDRIELGKLKSSGIIKVAVFVIGGLLIIDNIPIFLSHTFFAFKNDLNGIIGNGNSGFYWAVSAIKIIIGFLLITNYKYIATIFKVKDQALK